MTSYSDQWWGMRVRLPPSSKLNRPNVFETIVFYLVISLIAELLVLVVLIFRPDISENLTIFEDIKVYVVIPVAVVAACLALGLLLKLARLSPDSVVAFAREKGRCARWDLLFLIFASLGGAGVFLTQHPRLWPTELSIFGLVALVSLGFMLFQPGIDYSKRRWAIKIPDWLRPGTGKDVDQHIDEVRKPEPGANIRFNFVGGQPIGIRLKGALVKYFRDVNCESKGYLYHEKPDAVVLMDRNPIDDFKGQERMKVLCLQMASQASAGKITRYMLAEEVLKLVQREFKYEYDKNSTMDFPGGPYTEYGRFPIETLWDEVGDCECTSILTASMLAYLGFEVALLHVTINEDDDEVSHHVAVGLGTDGLFKLGETSGSMQLITDETGRGYLYGETASHSASGGPGFGEIPKEWADVMTIRKIDPIASPRVMATDHAIDDPPLDISGNDAQVDDSGEEPQSDSV